MGTVTYAALAFALVAFVGGGLGLLAVLFDRRLPQYPVKCCQHFSSVEDDDWTV